MDIGRADRRITFQRRVETYDDMRQVVESYVNISNAPVVWAQVEEMTGDELFSAQQVHAAVTTRFRIRYRSDLDVKMRLVYSGINYDIHHIREAPGPRRRATEILASAAV